MKEDTLSLTPMAQRNSLYVIAEESCQDEGYCLREMMLSK